MKDWENKPVQVLQDIANRLRIHSVAATNASKSGHPTSCSSLAEIMSVLFFNVMRYDIRHPKHRSSDRLVLSKGHAAPILYAAWAEAGLFSPSELLQLRKLDSDLEGHPTPRLNFVDVATGSLGQGLSIACGMAYVGKYFDRSSYRVYCIIGDGESCEGSIWEALHFAGHYQLNNLCVIFDINRLGQSGPTSLEHNMDVYEKRLNAFGFRTEVLDGHDVESLCAAFHSAAQTTGQPTAILARTFKGKGFPGIEDNDNWHGKPLMDKGDAAMQQFQSVMQASIDSSKVKSMEMIDDTPEVDLTNIKLSTPPNYKIGDSIATRLAYGVALAKIAANNERVIGLDGDTKNSTYSDKLKNAFPERYIECYIAEQNLAGVAVGAACRDRTVAFASTFAAFLTRAFDQIRMAAISQSNVNFAGSHCGVSIGEDGPSQMGLEDIAMFRSIPGCTVFYPSDAVSAERAVEIAANTKGICFIRTSRPATSVVYRNDEHFEIGRAKIVRKSGKDKVLVIGAGVTLHEALAAADKLASTVPVRILDPFTVKPLDKEAIKLHAKECGGNVVVVEDHYPEGGLGEAVLSVLAEDRGVCVKHLAVREIPKSGPPNALLEKYGINSNAIVEAIRSF